MVRLRGNTFLLLLLRAGNDLLLNPREYGESKNGITKPQMLADLLRFADTSYNPVRLQTLGSYFSKYLSGKPLMNSRYLPFDNPSYRYGLNHRILASYPDVLRQMDRFCKDYLKTDELTHKFLVAGLLEAIRQDDTFDGEFDVGDRKIKKRELPEVSDFILQPFLVSVWNNILMNHPDVIEGAETYKEWTKKTSDNTAAIIKIGIGLRRSENIKVSTDLSKVGVFLTDGRAADKSSENSSSDDDACSDAMNDGSVHGEGGYDDTEQTKSAAEPRVEEYEAPFIDPATGQRVVAQFHVSATDNAIAAGIVYGGINLNRRLENE